MKSKIIIAGVVAFAAFCACSKSDDTGGGGGNFTPDCSVPKTFSADASSVFQTSCATNSSCHGSGSGNGPGELSTYTQIFNARSAIRSAVASGRMPKTGSLSSAQKNAVLCWIDSGAPNN
jgi:hypothetical protein